MDRRHFLHGMMIGSAALATANGAQAQPQDLEDETTAPEPVGDAPWELIHPYRVGSEVGLGWVVGDLSAVAKGACVLTVRHSSSGIARVHICVHSGSPRGIAHTQRFDLVLMNDGNGRLQTSESIGRVIKTLSWAVARNEHNTEIPEGLLSHDVRVGWYGSDDALR